MERREEVGEVPMSSELLREERVVACGRRKRLTSIPCAATPTHLTHESVPLTRYRSTRSKRNQRAGEGQTTEATYTQKN